MTKVDMDFDDRMKKENVATVSVDVKFASSHFPNYKIGANDQIVEIIEDQSMFSTKEAIAREAEQLFEQQERVSVRDLASKFEKGLFASSKLSDEARMRETVLLEKTVILKKLRDALESLKGRVAGKNEDDVKEAISMVEALAAQLTERESELIHEREEVKKLGDFFKMATEDVKKVADEEKANALTEIQNARAAVQRAEEALHNQEQIAHSSNQNMEEIMREVQEARRIKMLHQPSKVMDMEHELNGLRIQLADKSKQSLCLQKELALMKRGEENIDELYELDGVEGLGSYLTIKPCSDKAPSLSSCSIQWYRQTPGDDSKKELISGAIKASYALEPLDVGRILQVEVILNERLIVLKTTGPIDPAPGLGSYVEALVRRHETEFKVVVIQMNGQDHLNESLHILLVGTMTMKLCRGKTTVAKEPYSSSMQLCGVRGAGNAATQALFWQANSDLSFVLAFETERERNAAVMLARRFAFDCNMTLVGPGDRTTTKE